MVRGRGKSLLHHEMKQERMSTALVILNYNNWEDTIHCMESVEKYNTAPVKYIIVDNGSTRKDCVLSLCGWMYDFFGENCQFVTAGQTPPPKLPRATLITSKANEGYARGNNIGIQYVKQSAEIVNVMILNNDVLFVEDIIPSLAYSLVSLPDCAIVSPILYKKGMQEVDYNCARLHKNEWKLILSNFDMFSGLLRDYHILRKEIGNELSEPIEIELPSGSCMLMSKDTVTRLHIFDPNTFLYFEEDIIYKKIQRLGLKNYLLPNMKCVHLGASSTKKVKETFLMKTAFYSQKYYLESYCCLTLLQKYVLSLASLYLSSKLVLLSYKHKLLRNHERT